MDTAKETEQINQVCETAQRGLADEGSQGDTGCCDLSRDRQTGINLRPSRSRELCTGCPSDHRDILDCLVS